MTNLPSLHAFAKNRIWLELVQLAAELLTWTQRLAWPDQSARTWEPKRLRLRLLAVAGRIIRTGRRHSAGNHTRSDSTRRQQVRDNRTRTYSERIVVVIRRDAQHPKP